MLAGGSYTSLNGTKTAGTVKGGAAGLGGFGASAGLPGKGGAPGPGGAPSIPSGGGAEGPGRWGRAGAAGTATTQTGNPGVQGLPGSVGGSNNSPVPPSQNVLPTVTGISVSAGPVAGGATETITGTNFNGATTVDFGATKATNVKVVSDTEITVTIPKGKTGAVHVTVVTPGGPSDAVRADEFTYFGLPSLKGVSPAAGPLAGGTKVTITGSNLGTVSTATVQFGGVTLIPSGDNGATIVVDSPPSTFTATTSVPVTVTTAGGTSAKSSAAYFVYAAAPAVTGVTTANVNPAEGPATGGTTVTISGTDLGTAGTAKVEFGSLLVSPTSDNGTTIVVKSPPMAVSTGTQTVDVTIITVGGTSAVVAADQFTYFAVPVVWGVAPAAGSFSGGTAVTISGTNLGTNGTATVQFGGVSVTPETDNGTTIVVLSPPSSFTTKTTVPITVTTAVGVSAKSSAASFTYTVAPTITSVTAATSPAAGPLAGGTQVTITGTNLGTLHTVTVLFGGVTATVVGDNGTQIVVKSPETGDDTGTGVDTVDVTVATGGATASAADAFTYFDVPTVDEVDPARGEVGDSVTITGYAFGAPLTVYFGQAPATNVAVVPGTGNSQITATAPPGTGTVDVTVSTPGGTSAANPFSPSDEFTYFAIPTVTSVSPSSGPLPGGTQVTITGTNLGTLNTVTVLFGGIAAGLYSDDGTTIVLLSPAGAAAGPVDVTVSTQDGTSAITPTDQFTYLAIPTVTSVSPSSGPLSGGTQVTITGTNLGTLDTAVVLFGGISAGLPYSDDGTTIVILSPAGAAAGPVDVTVSDYYGTSATTPADQFTYTASAPGAARVNGRIAAHNASDLALLALTGQPSPSATIQREMVDNLMASLLI